MKQIAVYLVCILGMISCDDTIEAPGRLSMINLEQNNVTVGSSDSCVTVGVGADRITWYVLRSRTMVNGESSTLHNTTYKYSDERMKDIILYRDTLAGDWFKIIKNKAEIFRLTSHRTSFPMNGSLLLMSQAF